MKRPRIALIRWCLFLLPGFGLPSIGFGQTDQSATDFAHDIVPILQQHCVGCHGGREAKGSFSMNTRELLVDSGNVQPGKPDESKLIVANQHTNDLFLLPRDAASGMLGKAAYRIEAPKPVCVIFGAW